MSRRRAFALAILVSGISTAAAAQDLSLDWRTQGGPVLTSRILDLAALDALPQSEIVTTTPWTDGEQTFTGPSLGEVAKLYGRPALEANVVALNEYSAAVPAEDWEERGAILATRQNGATMEIRDKGPYWVMYPIDSSPELDTQFYHARMVWQVRGIEFIVE